MASINDVFNQLVNANTALGQIHADGIAQTNATNQLDGDVKSGFNATVNALNAIAQIEAQEAQLLYHLTQQADAIICVLEHISKNTCELVTQSTLQTDLQRQLRDDSHAVRDLTESANPAAALERRRHEELRRQIERCCPPDPPRPACTYEPCEHPKRAKEPKLPKVEKPEKDSPNPQNRPPN
jgi:hypothetical protein